MGKSLVSCFFETQCTTVRWLRAWWIRQQCTYCVVRHQSSEPASECMCVCVCQCVSDKQTAFDAAAAAAAEG